MSVTGLTYVVERPNDWLVAVILCAAAWRVTHLLMYEDGPFLVMRRIRAATGVLHSKDDGKPIAHPEGNVFACFLCLSIWVSVAMALLLLVPPAWVLLVPFAISGVAIWLQDLYGSR